MKKPFFFNDMLVYSDDLNYLNSSKEEELTNRFQGFLTSSGGISNGGTSVASAGILGSPADYLLEKNLNCIKHGEGIRLYYGKALDINGELINNIDNVFDMDVDQSDVNYFWTSSPSVLNYIKIKYLEASGSIQTDNLGNSHYTRYTPSYFVTIDDIVPASPEILLGTFMATTTGIVDGAITDKRLYARLITSASSVYLDPLDKPVETWETVEDHVNAKGSGTPVATNPHGLTAADLGITDISDHNVMSHTAGIVALNGVYDSAVYASFTPTATDLGMTSQIAFDIPNANAGILVGGFVYTDSLPTILLSDTSIFTEGLTDVKYYVYLNNLGEIKASTVAGTEEDSNRFDIVSIVIIDGGSGFDDLDDVPADLRKFKSLHQQEIRADLIQTVIAPSTPLSSSSTLIDNLNRIRWQLGKAIRGIGTSWNTESYPLTAGSTSYADGYHSHLRTPSLTYTLNSNAAANFSSDMSYMLYRGMPGGVAKYASLYWSYDQNGFRLYEDQASHVYANLSIGTLFLKNNELDFYTSDHIPIYGGISTDLEASGSTELIATELSGSAFTETTEDFLDGSSVQPALVFSTDPGDSWFHLWLNYNGSPATSTHGNLAINALNVNGQVINANRIAGWNSNDAFTSFVADISGTVTNGVGIYTIKDETVDVLTEVKCWVYIITPGTPGAPEGSEVLRAQILLYNPANPVGLLMGDIITYHHPTSSMVIDFGGCISAIVPKNYRYVIQVSANIDSGVNYTIYKTT